MKCKYCFAELEADVTVCPVCGKDLAETEEMPAAETTEELVEETTEALVEETTEALVEETTEEIVEETEEELEEEFDEDGDEEFDDEDDEEFDDEEDDEEFEEVFFSEKKRRRKKPGKKMPKALAVTLASIGGVALACALFCAVLYGMGLKFTSIGAFFGLTEADLDYKRNYSVSDGKLEKKADEIVARVGNQTLTNEQLQVYYWFAAREYVNQYNTALQYGQTVDLGFDPEKPLNEQTYDPKTGKTWQQFFIETGLRQWQTYILLVQLAEDAGYELPEDVQEYLATYDEEMNTAAVSAGLADAEELIDTQISPGSTAAAYYKYVEWQYTALCYLETRESDLEVTDQEIEDYYAAHEDEMKANGCGKEDGKYYDVRHIYVTVEGEMTQLEDGTAGYTEEQWEACRAEAQKILDDFLANDPTEEKFAELAKEFSEDTGSSSNGGLYTYLTEDYGFIQAFEDWYVDESRKPGDTGLVKNTGSSKLGYHIMYFSDSREIWKEEAEVLVLDEKMEKILNDAEAQYPMTVNYKNLALGKADLVESE